MSERAVIIRRAIQEDFSHVVRMLRELAAHVSSPLVPRVTEAVLMSDGPLGRDRFRIFIAEENEIPIGLCLYTFAFSGWRGACGLFIEDLYVDDSARGLGVGRRLLAAALNAEKSDGATFVKLEVSNHNEGAIAFYQRMGFTVFENERLMVLEAQNLQP